MKKFLSLIAVAGILFACQMPLIYGQNYAKIMNKRVKKALGANSGLLKGFEWIPVPTTNYGLMTSFAFDIDSSPNFRSEWCAGFSCLGIDTPSSMADVLSMNGYADHGASGTVSLEENEKKSLSIGFALPAIYGVLGVGGGFDKNSVIDTSMSLGTVHVRTLKKGKALRYLQEIPSGSENYKLRTALQSKQLGLVVADVIVESMTVTLKPKTGMGVNLDASLNNPIPGNGFLPKIFGVTNDKKPGLTLKVSKQIDGTYVFVVSQPVVVARMIARYPIFGAVDGTSSMPSPSKTQRKALIRRAGNSLQGLGDWELYTHGKSCTPNADLCVATIESIGR